MTCVWAPSRACRTRSRRVTPDAGRQGKQDCAGSPPGPRQRTRSQKVKAIKKPHHPPPWTFQIRQDCISMWLPLAISLAAAAAPSCPNGCSLRGVCTNGVCECYPGYGGADCATKLRCPADCHQNGVCFNASCACYPGWSGEDCSARTCPKGCSERGTCVSGTCQCNANYTGEACDLPACPNDCTSPERESTLEPPNPRLPFER